MKPGQQEGSNKSNAPYREEDSARLKLFTRSVTVGNNPGYRTVQMCIQKRGKDFYIRHSHLIVTFIHSTMYI